MCRGALSPNSRCGHTAVAARVPGIRDVVEELDVANV
jgi:hypothetical protein